MKKFTVMAIASLMSFAGQGTIIEASKGDLVSQQVVRNLGKRVMNAPMPTISRDVVSMSWALPADKAINLGAQAVMTKSRDFWMEVSGADFNEGISLKVADQGALVRISPMSASAKVPALTDLVMVNDAGTAFSGNRGLSMLLDPEQVPANQKMTFSEGTAIFRLNENVGNGEVLLFSDNLAYADDARYIVHVRERNSAVELHTELDRSSYLAGQEIAINTAMMNGKKAMDLTDVEGEIVSPEGKRFPLNFAAGVAKARINPAHVTGMQNGLWEVQLRANAMNDGAPVARNLRTAFEVALPTARLAGDVVTARDNGEIVADLGVDVGIEGRYEVRGLLYGTNAEGEMVPMAISHSANWLQAGAGNIALTFDADAIGESDLKAPFMVKDLRLIHQDRMSLVQHQREGFHID